MAQDSLLEPVAGDWSMLWGKDAAVAAAEVDCSDSLGDVPDQIERQQVDKRPETVVDGMEASTLGGQGAGAGSLPAEDAPAVLGEYTILEPLGAGGMGRVFKALHRRMDRLVALKLFPGETVASSDAVDCFDREVRAAARLVHPNIVTAYDAGEQDGIRYLVMELVEGQDLSRRVRRYGPLSVADAVDAVLQAARGLKYAHEKGVVHRDIKPSNLLLSTEGVVKILDLGLARLHIRGQDESLPRTGGLVGTVGFMAPEQALCASDAGRQADIYSLGCTLYFLLTGKPVYPGERLMEIAIAHLERPIPSLQAAREGVSAALDSVFRRMIAKKPEERHESMAHVIDELERLQSPGQLPAAASAKAEVSGSSHGRRWALVGTALAGFLIVKLVWYLAHQPQAAMTTSHVPPRSVVPSDTKPADQLASAAPVPLHFDSPPSIEMVFENPEKYEGQVLVFDRLKLSGAIGDEGPRGNRHLIVQSEKGLAVVQLSDKGKGFAFYARGDMSRQLVRSLDPRQDFLVEFVCKLERWQPAPGRACWRARVTRVFFYGANGLPESVVEEDANRERLGQSLNDS